MSIYWRDDVLHDADEEDSSEHKGTVLEELLMVVESLPYPSAKTLAWSLIEAESLDSKGMDVAEALLMWAYEREK